ncbi:3-isopropylmalate dehydratase small subunit [Ktedonosporobacter rubrisoli]|uniref:3-isopropylmalate dehydratase small subunit n=1 Tax=Ktedonosporobacter rubrisoli TaxID=2509675 RepID=A0A4P6JQ56_KTERU|nr:3-isopropylmalate dehydratase small subunit [Ktedonosporobacter rubrisoli]QBD77445.1 3-isopropylmalate dehydratase small subunit [Ktedonosporobacter rubrisoli]
MQPFTTVHGKVMPLDRANVDTDAVIPVEYLKVVSRTGFADGLFAYWRYLNSNREPNPDFVMNKPRYQGVSILLTRENFGCGSSREMAPWALYEYGFRVIIAPSFADIFYNNCLNIGLLPVTLDKETVQELFDAVEVQQSYSLTADLASQTVTTPDGRSLSFSIDPFRKQALLQGLDAIGRTLQLEDKIASYEAQRRQEVPFFFDPVPEPKL